MQKLVVLKWKFFRCPLRSIRFLKPRGFCLASGAGESKEKTKFSKNENNSKFYRNVAKVR